MFKECFELLEVAMQLPALENGREMFYGCSKFENGPTSCESLQTGIDMFTRCRLNRSTVVSLLNSLPAAPAAQTPITLGMKGEGESACLEVTESSDIPENRRYKKYLDVQ